MPELPTWEVDLTIHGPIAVKERNHLIEPKGFSLPIPFQSDIRIRTVNTGVQATVTAYASNKGTARKVSLFFMGQMLDILALKVNLPLFLSYSSQLINRAENYSERRIITLDEWHEAFYDARLLALSETTFIRALGWYRKGLYTEDPFDSFLAFWNSIEIVAGKYHPDNERAKNGSKSQIWECFKAIWGECQNWPLIPGQDKWIDNNYETRISIAHGTEPVSIDKVEKVIDLIPVIHDVAYLFLTTWKNDQLRPQIPEGQLAQFGY